MDQQHLTQVADSTQELVPEDQAAILSVVVLEDLEASVEVASRVDLRKTSTLKICSVLSEVEAGEAEEGEARLKRRSWSATTLRCRRAFRSWMRQKASPRTFTSRQW